MLEDEMKREDMVKADMVKADMAKADMAKEDMTSPTDVAIADGSIEAERSTEGITVTDAEADATSPQGKQKVSGDAATGTALSRVFRMLRANPVHGVSLLVSLLYIVWLLVVNGLNTGLEDMLYIDLTSDATKLFALYLVTWGQSLAIPAAVLGTTINLIGMTKIKTKFVGLFDAFLIAIFCTLLWGTVILYNGGAV